MPRLILAVTCLIALVACDNSPHELTLVTPAGPADRAIVEDLVELFADGRVSSRILLSDEAMSGEAALDAIASGQADIALISNHFDFRPDITTVMPLYPTVLHIARREGADQFDDFDILRGESIYAGAEGSASRKVFEGIAKRMGLSSDDFQFAAELGEAPDAIIVFAPISPERIQEFPDLVLSSLGTPEEIGAGGFIDAVVLLSPNFRPFVIPARTYGDVTPKPVVTVAVDKILVARSNLDSTVVYDLINDILRLRPALAAKRPGLFQQLSEDFDASRSRFILHAGTQAYLQRSAPTIYERYSGVAEVAVTLMIALFSASFAGVRIFRLRRKNRIDRFYAATIDIRNSIKESTIVTEREQMIVRIRELQDEAFDLLVHEKLAADESFRIFITLSNDVLRQLGEAAS